MAKPENTELYNIAKKMLDPSAARENKRLNPHLKETIKEANGYCENADGLLISRQAISVLITDWRKRNPHKNPLIRA